MRLGSRWSFWMMSTLQMSYSIKRARPVQIDQSWIWLVNLPASRSWQGFWCMDNGSRNHASTCTVQLEAGSPSRSSIVCSKPRFESTWKQLYVIQTTYRNTSVGTSRSVYFSDRRDWLLYKLCRCNYRSHHLWLRSPRERRPDHHPCRVCDGSFLGVQWTRSISGWFYFFL